MSTASGAAVETDEAMNHSHGTLSLYRGTAYLNHILRAASHLDRRTIVSLFLLRRPSQKPQSARIRKTGVTFWYRGFLDRGVMSHFYEPGYDLYAEDGRALEYIVDLGANIGDETVKFAVRHPSARILALEPEPENYALLRKNSAPFGERVIPLQAGIWHRDTNLDVIPGPSPEGCTVAENPNGLIRARSLSSVMAEYGIPHIDILKVDIEGAEYELFAPGSEEWLPKVGAVVMEIADHERKGSCQNFFRALERAGFEGDCFICGENLVVIRHGSGLRLRVKAGL